MRFMPPHVRSLILILVVSACVGWVVAQEPSASLRQADRDYRDGLDALNRNDLKTAQSKFEAVTKLAPSAEQGHSALGAVLVREGQWAAGTRELEKALAIKPADGAAQLNLAMVYEQTGALAKAVPLFSKLEATAKSEHHPLSPTILSAYATSLASTGQIPAAIARMKEAVAQVPHSPELHDELGSLFAQQREWQQAELEFSQAIQFKNDYAAAHLHLGLVLQAEQKPGAIDEWMKAYQLAPEQPTIAIAVGKALADAGQDERAAPILERAVRLDPKSNQAAYQLALVLQRLNRVQESIPLLKRVVDSEPKNAEALVNLGMALAQAHEAKDAVPYLQRAIALKPKDATAHQDLAASYIQISQIDDAVVELKTALKLSPDSPQLHYDLGTAYKLQDNAADAIPELQAAEKLNPSGYEPGYVLGLLYMQVARYQEAAQQLELSLKLHPQNGDGWATLGSVYNKLDRLPEAVTALQHAIHLLPDQADSHLILATVLMKQNQTAQAAEERKVAANLMRTHMNLQRAEVATSSGKSLLASGKLDEAVVQFRDALTFDPKFVDAHTGLANALEKQGKPVEAAAERALAKSLSNTTP
jgi:tetratricopeptide (TPR) repeat protein